MTTETTTKTTALFYLQITVDGLKHEGKVLDNLPLFIFRTGRNEAPKGEELVPFWGDLPKDEKGAIQEYLEELLTFREAQKIARAALEGRLFPGAKVRKLEYLKQDLESSEILNIASMHFSLDFGASCVKYGFRFDEEETGFPFYATFGPNDLEMKKLWLFPEEAGLLETALGLYAEQVEKNARIVVDFNPWPLLEQAEGLARKLQALQDESRKS